LEISDDNSTDDTIIVLRGIMIIGLNYNNPLYQKLWNAIINSSGIFSFSQDDIWFENKIEVCIERFSKANYDLFRLFNFDSESKEFIQILFLNLIIKRVL
jgi:hypothetical protein